MCNAFNMDLLKNSSKYNDYLQRIQEYKQIADNNEAFSIMEVRVNNIYADLKSSHSKDYYKNIFLGILTLTGLVAIICFFTSHIMLGVITLISLAAAKLYFNRAVKPHASESKKEQQLVNESVSFDSKLLHTMRYLENGIDLKAARIIAVRFIYIGLFSILMFTGATILNIENTTSSVVLYGISILMNAGFWFYFFKDDLEELEYIGMELDEYLVSFQESIQDKKAVIENGASAQKEVGFYNFDSDEPIDIIPSPLPTEEGEQKEYKQLKLELK